jgi:hypothetical protein
LGEGWHELEGVFGNRYRWISGRATAVLRNMRGGAAQTLRIRGFAPEAAGSFRIGLKVNGVMLGEWPLERPGLFVLEKELPAATEYQLEITASPVWQAPNDSRKLSVNLSLLRLQAVE